MAILVFVDDVATSAELFAHVGHFLSESGVLSLEESGADGDLVLFKAARVTWALRRLVVLYTPAPVLLILKVGREQDGNREKEIERKKTSC